MYGKHFESMYQGSMVGAGAHVFAVWGYVISHQKPDKKMGSQVELNPKVIAFLIGETLAKVESAISFLCSPDKESRTKDEGGRRLIRIGEYSYRVVNGERYRKIRDQDARRESNREAARRFRQKMALQQGVKLPGESSHEALTNAGASDEELDRHVDSTLPEGSGDELPQEVVTSGFVDVACQRCGKFATAIVDECLCSPTPQEFAKMMDSQAAPKLEHPA